MYKSVLAILFAASVVVAAPAAVQKRTPSDKSGKATMAFSCDDTTISQPGGAEGQGEGGAGLFSTNMQFTDEKGVKHSPTACTSKDAFCGNCLFEGNGLGSPTNATGCSNPAAGACSLEYNYKGYDYNSETKEPKCGHENKGGAFSDTKTAICYFDV